MSYQAAASLIPARPIAAPGRPARGRFWRTLALGLAWLWTLAGSAPAFAADDQLIVEIQEPIKVSDVVAVAPPALVAVEVPVVVMDVPTVAPPAVVAVDVPVVVMDLPTVAPPAVVAVDVPVVVMDVPTVAPPAVVAVDVPVVVMDVPTVAPPAVVAVDVPVVVMDVPTVAPAVVVAVDVPVMVMDMPFVAPPAVVDVGELISVIDAPTASSLGMPPSIQPTSGQIVQHSDQLQFGLSASDGDDAPAALRFTASGLPAGLALADNMDGTATISGRALAPAGIYSATLTVSDPGGLTSSREVPITVTPEDGGLKYTGSTRVYAGTPISLTATLTQTLDGLPGDLSRAALTFRLTDHFGATTSHGSVAVSASGFATRTIPAGLPKGTYTVTAQVDPANGYYQAVPSSVTLAVPEVANQVWAVRYVAGSPSPGYSYALPFFQFWQRVLFQNTAASTIRNVKAYIDHVAANTKAVDDQVTVGTIAAKGYTWSSDSFTLRVDLRMPSVRCDGFTWRVEYEDASYVPRVATDVPQFPPGPAPGGCR